MNWYLKVLKQYADFEGRARRKEYWMFILFNIIFAIVAIMLDGALGTNMAPLPYGYIYFAYAAATLIPGLAVGVRRLHDIGKSGWFILLAFVPLANIWLLVLLATDGVRGDNEYGPDPKGGIVPDVA
jgi:uncharacterized membrane protein YhaH (DUF805 family)